MNAVFHDNVGKTLSREEEWRELVLILLHDDGECRSSESVDARRRELLNRLMRNK